MPCMLPDGRGLGGVVVGVGVEPEHGQLAPRLGAARGRRRRSRPSRPRGRRRERSGRPARPPWRRRGRGSPRVQPAMSLRWLQRAASPGPSLPPRPRPRQRAAVGDAVAEVGERQEEAGGPERLRGHRRAAGGGAELELDAEERDVLPVARRRLGRLQRCRASAGSLASPSGQVSGSGYARKLAICSNDGQSLATRQERGRNASGRPRRHRPPADLAVARGRADAERDAGAAARGGARHGAEPHRPADGGGVLLGFTVRLAGDAEARRCGRSCRSRCAPPTCAPWWRRSGACPRSGGCIRPTAAGIWSPRSTPPTLRRSTATLTAIRALKPVANSETSILLAELSLSLPGGMPPPGRCGGATRWSEPVGGSRHGDRLDRGLCRAERLREAPADPAHRRSPPPGRRAGLRLRRRAGGAAAARLPALADATSAGAARRADAGRSGCASAS